MGSLLDKFDAALKGTPEEAPQARDPNDVGSAVGDRRRLSDPERLQILEQQRDNPDPVDPAESALNSEISTLRRAVRTRNEKVVGSGDATRSTHFMDRFDAALEKAASQPYPEAPRPDANMDARDRRAAEYNERLDPFAGKSNMPGDLDPGAEAGPSKLGEVLHNAPAIVTASLKQMLANRGLWNAEASQELLRGQPDETNLDARDIRARERPRAARPGDVFGPEPSLELPPEMLKEGLKTAEKAGEHYKEWAAQTKKELELFTPEHMNTFDQSVFSVIQSSPPQAVALAVGILTRNPWLAGSVAGLGGAEMQGTQTYGEAREAGASPSRARTAGVIQGAIELSDFIPIGVAFKPGSTFLRRLFETAAAEGVTEGVQQFAQDVQAMVTYNPEMTLGEMWQNIQVAGIAGALGGVVFSAGIHATTKAMEAEKKRGERKDQDEQVRQLQEERGKPGLTREQAESVRSQVENIMAGAGIAPTPRPDFAATHTLEDGTPVVATKDVHEGTGQPVWRDAQNNEYVAPRAEPIQKTPPNATFSSGGVDYDVTVVGKGRRAGSVRLADGQEVSIAKLTLDDNAKELLGLLPKEEQADKKAPAKASQGEPEPKAPKPTTAPPPSRETEPPPPRGSRSEGEAGPPKAKVQEREVIDDNRAHVDEPAFQKWVEQVATTPGATGFIHLAYNADGKIVASGPLEQMPQEIQTKIAKKELSRATLRVKPTTTRVLGINYYTARPKEEAEQRLEKSLMGRRLNPDPTEAEQKARDAGRERFKQANKERQRVDVERDTLIPFIIKLGGLSKAYQLDTVGDTSARSNPNIAGVGYLFSPRGDSPDEIARRAVEFGYLTDEADVNELQSMIKAELMGTEKYYSAHRSQQAIEQAERERFEDEEAARPEEEPGPSREEIEAVAGDAPIELDVLPSDFDEAPVGSEPEANVIADLLGQLSEDEGERIAMQYANASPVEFIDALKKRIAEVTRGKEETLRTGRDSGDLEGGGSEEGKARQPPGKYDKGEPAERRPAEGGEPASEAATKPLHEEARPQARDRLTAQAVKDLLASVTAMNAQEKQEAREWIDREMTKDEREGQEIAEACLGQGGNFGI